MVPEHSLCRVFSATPIPAASSDTVRLHRLAFSAAPKTLFPLMFATGFLPPFCCFIIPQSSVIGQVAYHKVEQASAWVAPTQGAVGMWANRPYSVVPFEYLSVLHGSPSARGLGWLELAVPFFSTRVGRM